MIYVVCQCLENRLVRRFSSVQYWVEAREIESRSESSFKSESTTHSSRLRFDTSVKTEAKPPESNPFF